MAFAIYFMSSMSSFIWTLRPASEDLREACVLSLLHCHTRKRQMFHIELFDTDIGRFKGKFSYQFWSLYWICYNPGSSLHFGFFDWEACGTYAPWPGMDPACPALEGEVLATYWKSLIGKKNLKIIVHHF